MSSWVHLHNTPAPTFSRLFCAVVHPPISMFSPPSHQHKHKQTNGVLSKRGPSSQGCLRLLSLRTSVPANGLPHLQSSNSLLSLFPLSFLSLSFIELSPSVPHYLSHALNHSLSLWISPQSRQTSRGVAHDTVSLLSPVCSPSFGFLIS